MHGTNYIYEWRAAENEVVKYEETLEDVLYPALLQLLTIAATTDDNTIAFAALNVAYNLLNEARADLTSTPPPAPNQVLTLTDGDGISTRYELDPKTNLWHDSSGVAYEIETDKVAAWQKEEDELRANRAMWYQIDAGINAKNAAAFQENKERDIQRSIQEAAQNRFVKDKLTYLEKCVNDRVKGKPEDSYLRGMQGCIEAALNEPGIGENIDPAKFMQLRNAYGNYLSGKVGDESDMLRKEKERLEKIARLDSAGVGGTIREVTMLIPFLNVYTSYSGVTDTEIVSNMVDLFEPQIGQQTMYGTAEEIASGSSWKAIGLRVGAAIGTGGASEWVFAPAKAAVVMKNYVDQGGDSKLEGFRRATREVVIDELLGRAIAGTVSGAGKFCQNVKAAYQAGKAGKQVNLSLFGNKAAQGQLSDLNKAAGKAGKEFDISLIGGGGNALGSAVGSALDQLDDAAKAAKQTAVKEADELIKAAGKKNPSKGANPELIRAAEEAQEAGRAKLLELQAAADDLGSHTTFSEAAQVAQQRFDNARMAVQADPSAKALINRYVGTASDNLRYQYNVRTYQIQQAATETTLPEISKHFGGAPTRVFNATNNMQTTNILGSTKLAKNPAGVLTPPGQVTNPNQIPLDGQRFRSNKVSTDYDITIQVEQLDEITGRMEWRDVPKETVEFYYNRAYYQVNHGTLPTKRIGGEDLVDYEVVNKFAKDMDQTAVDLFSADAYGKGFRDVQSVLSRGGDAISVGDSTTVSYTMAHKSTEWFNRADEAMETAMQQTDPVQRRLWLSIAEGDRAEAVRQITKQQCNQVERQVAAINRAKGAGTVKIPERLQTSIEVLNKIGSGTSPEVAEQALKDIGTSMKDVSQQSSALMEAMLKFEK